MKPVFRLAAPAAPILLALAATLVWPPDGEPPAAMRPVSVSPSPGQEVAVLRAPVPAPPSLLPSEPDKLDRPAILPPGFKADLVRVEKAARKLHLLRGGVVMASYSVALGDNPLGHKQQEGDERTPEGRYVIDWRNAKSRYFLSLHISYPDAQDRTRAKTVGVDPGGMIMIHGQPNGSRYAAALLQGFDWTDGCIAVTNDQMQQIWDSVPDRTAIEIVP